MTEHKIQCVGGSYKCTCGEIDTLNRWVAESHLNEVKDIDKSAADAPEWLLE